MIRDSVEGAICNMGAISEHAGQPFISAYCASKGALASLTRNTAFAVMKNRIRVNQRNVGWMSSDNERELQAASGGPDWKAKVAAALPFGRLVDPEEAARAVNFIVSNDARRRLQDSLRDVRAAFGCGLSLLGSDRRRRA